MTHERTVPPKPRTDPDAALRAYAASLRSADEVSELILLLEGDRHADPGLSALAQAANLDLENRDHRKRAIVALGDRARELAGRPSPSVAPHDLPAFAQALLTQVEAVRIADAAANAETLARVADDSLAAYRRDAPPRTPEDAAWMGHVDEAVRDRFVPAYTRAADRANRLEDGRLTGPLLKSPFAMGLLVALPGLLTLPMPLSTPLVCLCLALFGTFVVHPAWVRQIAEPLRAPAENLAAEEPRISRLSSGEPWTAGDLRLESVVNDLLPVLENTRRAGVTGEGGIRDVIARQLAEVEPHLAETGRSEAYFQLLRRFCEGRLARDFARYAAARATYEGNFVARILDTPWASALLFAVVTLPFSLLASLATPFPPGVDLPLMVLLFGIVGGFLPRLLPGTLPARAALLRDLATHQAELDNLG